MDDGVDVEAAGDDKADGEPEGLGAEAAIGDEDAGAVHRAAMVGLSVVVAVVS